MEWSKLETIAAVAAVLLSLSGAWYGLVITPMQAELNQQGALIDNNRTALHAMDIRVNGNGLQTGNLKESIDDLTETLKDFMREQRERDIAR